ncbi:glycosyltransferase family 4 protein [Microbacterium sp. M1A1_1b]
MTKILLEVLAEDGRRTKLVDRRFSRAVDEVGALSLRKIVAVPSLVLRLALAVVRRPDACIFFCTNRSFSFLVDVVLGEVLRLFRVPTVNYVHTSGYSDLAARGKVWRWMVQRLLSHGATTVCLADSLVADIAPFVGKRTIVVIANTIDDRPDRFAETRRRPDGMNTSGPILFLSNLLEEKGADVFVDMAITLCDRSDQLTFALVGQPADRTLADALQLRVVRSGHASRVQFLGPRFGEDKWDVLAGAQLLVFPSRYRFEAQPLTIVEAFSLGVPVVASDVGAIGEMVGPENGYLLSEATVDEAVRAVSLLATDPERHRLASEGARRAFDQKYSRATFRAAWNDVIESVQKDAA